MYFSPKAVCLSFTLSHIPILLIKSLLALKEMGYAYAIIGGVGPAAYYEQVVNARIIEKSEKSIYHNLLRQPK